MTLTPEREAMMNAALDDLAAFIRRFVVLTDAQLTVCALWVLSTHASAQLPEWPSISETDLLYLLHLPPGEEARLLEVLRPLVSGQEAR